MDTMLKVFIENVEDISAVFALRQTSKSIKALCDERLSHVMRSPGNSLLSDIQKPSYSIVSALDYVDHIGIIRVAVKRLVIEESLLTYNNGQTWGKKATSCVVESFIESMRNRDVWKFNIWGNHSEFMAAFGMSLKDEGAIGRLLDYPSTARWMYIRPWFYFRRGYVNVDVANDDMIKAQRVIFKLASKNNEIWREMLSDYWVDYGVVKENSRFICELWASGSFYDQVFTPLIDALNHDDVDMLKEFVERGCYELQLIKVAGHLCTKSPIYFGKCLEYMIEKYQYVYPVEMSRII